VHLCEKRYALCVQLVRNDLYPLSKSKYHQVYTSILLSSANKLYTWVCYCCTATRRPN